MATLRSEVVVLKPCPPWFSGEFGASILVDGHLAVLSGSLHSDKSMMKSQHSAVIAMAPKAGGLVEEEVLFLAPAAPSQKESIGQMVAAVTADRKGDLTFEAGQGMRPLRIHLSGMTLLSAELERKPVEITATVKGNGKDIPDIPRFTSNPRRPFVACRHGLFVFLEGEVLGPNEEEVTFGIEGILVGRLPPKLCPPREVRFLAPLRGWSKEAELTLHSVAVTVKANGEIAVVGGRPQHTEKSGQTKVLSGKKKGVLCFDGVRFSLQEHEELRGRTLQGRAPTEHPSAPSRAARLLGLGEAASKFAACAACSRQGDAVMLQGILRWSSHAEVPMHPHCIAVLPYGCRPLRRETFFVRGGSNLQEKLRVDIDKEGRVFCIEGIGDGADHVDLSGILFVAAAKGTATSAAVVSDLDEISAPQPAVKQQLPTATVFDGAAEELMHFIRGSRWNRWDEMKQAFRVMPDQKWHPWMPFGGEDTQRYEFRNWKLADSAKKFMEKFKRDLQWYGISDFCVLLWVSDRMIQEIFKHLNPCPTAEEKSLIYQERYNVRAARQKQHGGEVPSYMQLQGVASGIVNQMFDFWDLDVQVSRALSGERGPPESIRYLMGAQKSNLDKVVQKAKLAGYLKQEDMAHVDKIRSFFAHAQTNSNNLTHSSLKGSRDAFTTTGKFFFEDTENVQKQLFEHIAWLYTRGIFHYLSERQTKHFPFIEDIDVQFKPHCKPDWPEEPPDWLIMDKPVKVGIVDPDATTWSQTTLGKPGEFMKLRAKCLHKLYPQIPELTVIVYSASGFNKGKKKYKTSFHLVWRELIVDSDRAGVIRYVTLGDFTKASQEPGSHFERLQSDLTSMDDSDQNNNWHDVFDKTTVNATNGLRLPYNDKASKIPTKEDQKEVDAGRLSKAEARRRAPLVEEGRYAKPIGKIKFAFMDSPDGSFEVDGRWIEDGRKNSETVEDIANWISLGTCRRSEDTPLTDWYVSEEIAQELPKRESEDTQMKQHEDGSAVTHTSLPQVRRYDGDVGQFKRELDSAFKTVIMQKIVESGEDQPETLLAQYILQTGSWVSVTPNQAIWRSQPACQRKWYSLIHTQFRELWGEGKRPPGKQQWIQDEEPRPKPELKRPWEVIFLRQKQKVVVDGPTLIIEQYLLPAVTQFTSEDDAAIRPTWDEQKLNNGDVVPLSQQTRRA